MRMGLALAVLLLATAGCGGSGSGPGSPGVRSSDGSELTGRTFLSTEVDSHTLLPGTEIRLNFPEKGKLNAQAGCNHLFGDVVFEGDKLVVSQMGSTDMGCDPSRHAQDEWLTGFFKAKPTWALTGDELVLTGKDTKIWLTDRKAANPDRSILDTRWKVTSIINGESAGSVPADVTAELIFTGNGKVNGTAGCNQLSGTAKQGDGKITFEAIGTTKKLCTGEAVMNFENSVLAVLDGEVSAKVDGDQLELKHPNGKGLILTVVP